MRVVYRLRFQYYTLFLHESQIGPFQFIHSMLLLCESVFVFYFRRNERGSMGSDKKKTEIHSEKWFEKKRWINHFPYSSHCVQTPSVIHIRKIFHSLSFRWIKSPFQYWFWLVHSYLNYVSIYSSIKLKTAKFHSHSKTYDVT